jgi:arylsulfatase A-like enzyme
MHRSIQLTTTTSSCKLSIRRSPLRRGFLFVAHVIAFAWFTLLPTAWAQTAPANIVVILADDLGYGDVGFNGCADIPTPNIDSVAANGALCTNGYSTHCYCSPSRAAIITGRYQHRFGYDTDGPSIGSSNPRQGLPATELTLPQLLKPAGYVCGAIGKWHLGYVPDFANQAGFDEFLRFLDAQLLQYLDLGIRDAGEGTHLFDRCFHSGSSFLYQSPCDRAFLSLPGL